MDEGRRRLYLAAMGIPLWLARGASDRVAGAVHRDGQGEASLGHAPVEAAAPGAAHDETTPEPLFADATGSAGTDTRDLGWDALRARVAGCTACPELVRNRSQTVFGVGNPQADLMVIGEAPGVDEDRQGEPFVGRAGRLLDLMLRAIGLPRERVFIANVLKCRPPNNRDPLPDEARRCEPFLARQLALVAPRVILSVGRISAQHLLRTDAPVGRLRGRLHHLGEPRIPLVVTYHPAYLLRSPEQKAKAWEDLQLTLKVLKEPRAGA